MVNLIARPIKKISKTQKIVLYSLVSLVFISIILYFFFSSLTKSAQNTLNDIKEQATEQRTPKMINLEESLQSYKVSIDEFSQYLNNHILITKFFDLLEKDSHPHLHFTQMNLSVSSESVSLSGVADSFLTLGQQLTIFKNDPMIKSVSLSSVSLSDEGTIMFSLKISLDANLFKY